MSQLPPRLKEIDAPITLDDFPEDDYCHACHGADEGCVACRLNREYDERFRREEIAERMADGW